MAISEEQELVAGFVNLLVESREPSVLWPAMLQRLQEVIGFDAGYMAASWGNSTEGRGAVAEHDEPFMKRNLGRYLAEIAPDEVAAYADRARNYDDVWPALRRKELAVFNEVLEPTNMRQMLVRVSVRSGNVAGFNLERRGISRRFSDRELALVDLVGPFLHIVERLTLESNQESTEHVAAAHGLTKREAEFAGYVSKGLQNAEIALLSGISINTVRNTLVRVFEKVGVSNRAELTYVVSQPPPDPRGMQLAQATGAAAFDDGTRAFARRVEEASNAKPPAPDLAVKPAPRSHIVYTPPLNLGASS